MSLKISTAVGSLAVSKPGTHAVKMDEIIKFISDEKIKNYSNRGSWIYR